ncbi:MAG TPA: helix-hairpin-helix domain-containing protein [Geobacteraceae bacterium]|nr:helix-hairpin-helix domain-containing protein [Geobacteraceae bacterium]
MKREVIHLFLGMTALLLAATVSFAASDTGTATAQPAKTTTKKQKSKKSSSTEDLMDINTATAEQLKSLPGLSDDEVKKIIAGRPYTRKNELKQKNIITAAQYDGIKKKIVAKKAAK